MTNFEYLLENEKELVKDILSVRGAKVAIDKKNKLRNCEYISCAECKFGEPCGKETLAWLDKEYEEPLPDTVMIPRDTPKHTLLWVKQCENDRWIVRVFSHFSSIDYPICFVFGNFDSEYTTEWTYAKPFVMGVNPNEDEKGAEE